MFNLALKIKKHDLKFDLSESPKFLKDFISSNFKKEIEIESKQIYRSDGTSVEKLVETDKNSGNVIRITYYDYFDDKKIKSIEDYEDGIKVRITLFSFFKSVTDLDKETGKKIRTVNYDIKNSDTKISVYDYDAESEMIVRVTVYRTDGKNIAFIKEISPKTGIISRCISYKKDSSAISSVSKFETLGDTTVKTTYYYSTPIYLSTPEMVDKKIISDELNKKVLDSFNNKNFNKLLDNLYKNKKCLAAINVS